MATDPKTTVQRLVFASAEEVEQHFYEAIRRCDVEALTQAWADDEDIICIHREGKRLLGTKQVHNSWRDILTQNCKFSVELKDKRVINCGMTVIHVMLEKITQTTAEGIIESVCHATNIFQKDSRGWHLIMHMATSAPCFYIDQIEAKNFPGYFH